MLWLALQEKRKNTKTLEAKFDMLNYNFTIYVDTVHHKYFVTKHSPHYALLKSRIETMQVSGGDTLGIKHKIGGASTSH